MWFFDHWHRFSRCIALGKIKRRPAGKIVDIVQVRVARNGKKDDMIEWALIFMTWWMIGSSSRGRIKDEKWFFSVSWLKQKYSIFRTKKEFWHALWLLVAFSEKKEKADVCYSFLIHAYSSLLSLIPQTFPSNLDLL